MTALDHAMLASLSPGALRGHIRIGSWRGHTAGLAPGYLQANVVILGEGYAADFLAFCRANPKPCPLVGVSRPGDPRLPGLGDIDIRTDVPSYNVYRDGQLAATVPDISDLWTGDLTAFALGCSFTFERALIAAGLRMRHVEANRTVAMYRTSLPLEPVGPFGGTMVVSMRPIPPDMVALAGEVSARFPHAHGAPVHAGDPAAVGIADLSRPDWGDPPVIGAGEIPVFWACGVTPQNVLAAARPPLCVTHTPGRMLVTDLPEDRNPDPFGLNVELFPV